MRSITSLFSVILLLSIGFASEQNLLALITQKPGTVSAKRAEIYLERSSGFKWNQTDLYDREITFASENEVQAYSLKFKGFSVFSKKQFLEIFYRDLAPSEGGLRYLSARQGSKAFWEIARDLRKTNGKGRLFEVIAKPEEVVDAQEWKMIWEEEDEIIELSLRSGSKVNLCLARFQRERWMNSPDLKEKKELFIPEGSMIAGALQEEESEQEEPPTDEEESTQGTHNQLYMTELDLFLLKKIKLEIMPAILGMGEAWKQSGNGGYLLRFESDIVGDSSPETFLNVTLSSYHWHVFSGGENPRCLGEISLPGPQLRFPGVNGFLSKKEQNSTRILNVFQGKLFEQIVTANGIFTKESKIDGHDLADKSNSLEIKKLLNNGKLLNVSRKIQVMPLRDFLLLDSPKWSEIAEDKIVNDRDGYLRIFKDDDKVAYYEDFTPEIAAKAIERKLKLATQKSPQKNSNAKELQVIDYQKIAK